MSSSGWLKTTMGGGNIAEVNPSDSAKDLMKIASDIDTISRKEMFIDHRRNKMHGIGKKEVADIRKSYFLF